MSTVRVYAKQQRKTPWCKFCKDMGFEGWDTHYTKDIPGPNGVVVCPKLLGIKCNRCNEFGHMVSHCKAHMNNGVGHKSNNGVGVPTKEFNMRDGMFPALNTPQNTPVLSPQITPTTIDDMGGVSLLPLKLMRQTAIALPVHPAHSVYEQRALNGQINALIGEVEMLKNALNIQAECYGKLLLTVKELLGQNFVLAQKNQYMWNDGEMDGTYDKFINDEAENEAMAIFMNEEIEESDALAEMSMYEYNKNYFSEDGSYLGGGGQRKTPPLNENAKERHLDFLRNYTPLQITEPDAMDDELDYYENREGGYLSPLSELNNKEMGDISVGQLESNAMEDGPEFEGNPQGYFAPITSSSWADIAELTDRGNGPVGRETYQGRYYDDDNNDNSWLTSNERTRINRVPSPIMFNSSNQWDALDNDSDDDDYDMRMAEFGNTHWQSSDDSNDQ